MPIDPILKHRNKFKIIWNLLIDIAIVIVNSVRVRVRVMKMKFKRNLRKKWLNTLKKLDYR